MAKIFYVFFFGVPSMGEKKHKSKISPEMRGQSREMIVDVFFSSVASCSQVNLDADHCVIEGVRVHPLNQGELHKRLPTSVYPFNQGDEPSPPELGSNSISVGAVAWHL